MEVADVSIIWMGPSVAMHLIDTINDPKGKKLGIIMLVKKLLRYHINTMSWYGAPVYPSVLLCLYSNHNYLEHDVN
jgi:hypothetical protein